MKRTAINGLLAGAAATVPMTLVMVALHRQLSRRDRYPLPPRVILGRLGHRRRLYEWGMVSEATPLTVIMHFAYGAATGRIYAATLARAPVPRVWSGLGFGLAVWATSYLGLLPALGLYPNAVREPASRNALMIAAHVVWGATLGWLLRARVPAAKAPRSIAHHVRPRPVSPT